MEMDALKVIENMTETIQNAEINQGEKSFKRDYAPHRRTSIRVCKDCGRHYNFPDSDAVYYITKYGALPLRCKKCREKRHTSVNDNGSDDII